MNTNEETGQQSSRSNAFNNNAACFSLQIANVEISPFELESYATHRESKYLC